MKKIIIAVSMFCLAIVIYKSQNDAISNINAEYYDISYGNSYYEGIDNAEKNTTEILVNDYNKIKLVGTTNQEINYDKSISIIFVDNDQISGQVTVDDNGVCRIGDKPDNYITDAESNIYEDGVKAYKELKEKIKS